MLCLEMPVRLPSGGLEPARGRSVGVCLAMLCDGGRATGTGWNRVGKTSGGPAPSRDPPVPGPVLEDTPETGQRARQPRSPDGKAPLPALCGNSEAPSAVRRRGSRRAFARSALAALPSG